MRTDHLDRNSCKRRPVSPYCEAPEPQFGDYSILHRFDMYDSHVKSLKEWRKEHDKVEALKAEVNVKRADPDPISTGARDDPNDINVDTHEYYVIHAILDNPYNWIWSNGSYAVNALWLLSDMATLATYLLPENSSLMTSEFTNVSTAELNTSYFTTYNQTMLSNGRSRWKEFNSLIAP